MSFALPQDETISPSDFLISCAGSAKPFDHMPRKMRVQYPGAMYHVISRGDRRDDIFFDDADRYDFLKTLTEACQKTDWQVHAFCLMRNHYHLVLETPDANLVAGHLERRRLEEVNPEALEAFRREWCLGGEACRQENLARMEGGLGEHHAGELRREAAEAKAERLVAEELRRLGWSEEELKHRRKNDAGKLAIAVRLRRETMQSIKAIAARVELGSYNTANAPLHRALTGARNSKGASGQAWNLI